MITVNCPQCKVENSALSSRCIACGSELVIEGYVRCENCRALTPNDLEFCELCGSFLPPLRTSEETEATGLSRIEQDYESKIEADEPQEIARTGQREKPELEDREKPSGTIGEPVPGTDQLKPPIDSDIPGWLLDVDAALKAGRGDRLGQDFDSLLEEGSHPAPGPAFDEPSRRLDTSDLPDDVPGSTASLEWLTALEESGDAAQDESKDVDDQQTVTKQESTGASEEDEQDETFPGEASGETSEPESRPRSTRRRGTQPLDLEGKLLGVPSQLAATNLPSWLSDQLERSDDLSETDDYQDVEIPKPKRATIPQPRKKTEIEGVQEEEETVLDPSFEKWLKELSDEPTSPEWMVDEEDQLDEALADDLSEAEVKRPKWLREITEEEEDTTELLGLEDTIEDSGVLAGLHGAIQIMPSVSTPIAAPPLPDYSLSPEHRRRIAILEGLIQVESTAKKGTSVRRKGLGLTARLRSLLGGSLLLLVLIGILFPASGELLAGSSVVSASVDAQRLYDQIRSAAGRPVLVAFDYPPAVSGELSPVADILLQQLAENDSTVITVSQSASGSELAKIVASEVRSLSWQDIGYFPGEAVGLRRLVECLGEAGRCESLFGEALPADIQRNLNDVALVLILTAESDDLISWVEQVEPHLEEASMIAAVTQTIGPLVNSYVSSNQLEGVLRGLPDATAYGRDLLGIESRLQERVVGLAPAMWLSVGSLIAAAIYFVLKGTS